MNIEEIIHWLHQGVHVATNDPEDTITVAMTQAELTACCLGAHIAILSFPCLTEVYDHLTHRLVELIEAQRPDWKDSQSWGDHGSE